MTPHQTQDLAATIIATLREDVGRLTLERDEARESQRRDNCFAFRLAQERDAAIAERDTLRANTEHGHEVLRKHQKQDLELAKILGAKEGEDFATVAKRVIAERDAATSRRIERLWEILGATPYESATTAAERVVTERDNALAEVVTMRAKVEAQGKEIRERGPAPWIQTRIETREILGATDSESLQMAASRVVVERNAAIAECAGLKEFLDEIRAALKPSMNESTIDAVRNRVAEVAAMRADLATATALVESLRGMKGMAGIQGNLYGLRRDIAMMLGMLDSGTSECFPPDTEIVAGVKNLKDRKIDYEWRLGQVSERRNKWRNIAENCEADFQRRSRHLRAALACEKGFRHRAEKRVCAAELCASSYREANNTMRAERDAWIASAQREQSKEFEARGRVYELERKLDRIDAAETELRERIEEQTALRNALIESHDVIIGKVRERRDKWRSLFEAGEATHGITRPIWLNALAEERARAHNAETSLGNVRRHRDDLFSKLEQANASFAEHVRWADIIQEARDAAHKRRDELEVEVAEQTRRVEELERQRDAGGWREQINLKIDDYAGKSGQEAKALRTGLIAIMADPNGSRVQLENLLSDTPCAESMAWVTTTTALRERAEKAEAELQDARAQLSAEWASIGNLRTRRVRELEAEANASEAMAVANEAMRVGLEEVTEWRKHAETCDRLLADVIDQRDRFRNRIATLERGIMVPGDGTRLVPTEPVHHLAAELADAKAEIAKLRERIARQRKTIGSYNHRFMKLEEDVFAPPLEAPSKHSLLRHALAIRALEKKVDDLFARTRSGDGPEGTCRASEKAIEALERRVGAIELTASIVPDSKLTFGGRAVTP